MDSLFDAQGNRKYLTADERRSFEEAAKSLEREARTFCLMLKHTGCRISEALSLRVKDIDFQTKSVTFETLKQGKDKKGNRKRIFRQVPISEPFLDGLDLVHDLKRRQRNAASAQELIWSFSRVTGWTKIKEVMNTAQIYGVQACPLGLRHGFAIACVENKIPLNVLQKWMGHKYMTTTAIYANVMGQEERNLAALLW
jgi:integrase/recombinase XerD